MVVPAAVERLGAGQVGRDGPDLVAVEAPLALDLEHGGGGGAGGGDGERRRDRVMTTLRTPGHDVELAVGWLWTEGVIASGRDVVAASPCPTAAAAGEDVLRVRLRPGLAVDLGRTVRIGTVTAACGACARPVGATSPAAGSDTGGAVRPGEESPDDVRVPLAALLAAPEAMRAAQPGFRHSGGLHAAALVDRDGRVRWIREDIGRHNAVDAVLGAWLGAAARAAAGAEAAPPAIASLMLVVSSRAGYEIVQKAAAAGIRVVASVGGASSLAIDVARRAGLTLAAFVRDGRASAYARRDRLVGPEGG